MSLADQRIDYGRGTLDERAVDPDPLVQFGRWFTDAEAGGVLEPNAMTLATVTAAGRPDARIVLLRGVDARGFAFFTDYRSQKGTELAANPHAALTFFWPPLERQVRITGRVERVSMKESEDYFSSRPRGSRLGAWASHQSSVLPDRDVLERAWAEAAERFGEGPIPCPPHWGGYRVVPDSIEFWQGRPNRLHDRIRYRRDPDGPWLLERLSP